MNVNSIVLRPYQQEAINAVYAHYRQSDDNVIIDIATGGGKSIVIAKIIQDICSLLNRRVLQLSHVKELVQQNYNQLLKIWPQAPVGIYSAGLNKRDIKDRITIASVQSCYDKGHILGYYHVVIIDEVHLLGEKDDGMYRTLITALKQINPKLKVIGLSATPWRTRGGSLISIQNALFTKIVYSIGIKELVNMGYLCPLVGIRSKTQADLSNVGIRMGEFNLTQMEGVIDNEALTNAALDEVLHIGKNRNAWLFFCSGINHAMHVRDNLRVRGIKSECITGKTPIKERDDILLRFKEGDIKALTNNAVLTTGTDIPRVDLLVLLRGTKSPGLMLQICGRGMRLSPETEKVNCQILDYAGNLERFGFIDQIKAPLARKKRDNQEAPYKFCSECGLIIFASALECAGCGYEFIKDNVYKHDDKATNAPVMSSEVPPVDDGITWYDVDDVEYAVHPGKIKKGVSMPITLRVSYNSGGTAFNEWICPYHGGKAYKKASAWLQDRAPLQWITKEDNRITIEAICYNPSILMTPVKIAVRKNGRFDEIVDYSFVSFASS